MKAMATLTTFAAGFTAGFLGIPLALNFIFNVAEYLGSF